MKNKDASCTWEELPTPQTPDLSVGGLAFEVRCGACALGVEWRYCSGCPRNSVVIIPPEKASPPPHFEFSPKALRNPKVSSW